MSEVDRGKLTEDQEAIEKARRLKKNLERVKDWSQYALGGVVILAILGTAGGLMYGLWIAGLGFIPITLGVVGTGVGLWYYMDFRADEKLAEARMRQRDNRWID